MMTRSKTQALGLGTALMWALGSTGAGAQQPPSPLAGAAAGRSGHARDVVVEESFRYFPGGKALPVTGDAALISRLNEGETATRDLGVVLTPGLEVRTGNSVRLSKAVTSKLVTLHPMAYRGVPLAPGSDVLSITTASGRVLAVRERNLPRSVDGTRPSVTLDAAKRAALEAGRSHDMPADARAGEPTLEVLVDASAQGRLAWRVRVESPSRSAPWARDIWLAALGAPAVLADRDGIYHTHHGNATAAAWSDSPLGASPAQPLASATVTRNGSAADTTITGPDGSYAFASGTGNATLAVGVSGLHSVVDNVAGGEVSASGSGSPAAPIDLAINAAGDAQLAQTSAFVWVDRAHGLAEAFLPSGALARVPTNVNIASSCNAFWNGSSLNFFHAEGGCVNTAYADVALHEYGHAVDQALGGILDGGYSEGFGDALSILGTRQFCVGRDFFGAGTCLRQTTDVVT